MDHTLKSVVLHITDKCTNHCPFCYAGASNHCFTHADTGTVYKIIDELSRVKVERVSLLGGDPALHPAVIDFAKYLVANNIKAGIMSNTMDFGQNIDEVIQYIDLFETTIHGRNAKEHDAICLKEGSYDFLMDHLRIISQFRDRVAIGIAINVTPDTADKIFEMVDRLVDVEKICMNYIVLQRIIPYGRAEKNGDNYMLSTRNLELALRDVERIHDQLQISIAVEDPFPLCAIDARYRKYMHQCEWGFSKASLDWRGNLTRCGADSKHILGNILETPLDEIWENSPQLKSFREKNYLPLSCKKCKLFDSCGGGCSLSCNSADDNTPDYLIKMFAGRPIE